MNVMIETAPDASADAQRLPVDAPALLPNAPANPSGEVPPWLYQAIFDTLQVGLAILDEQGTIVARNAAWDRFLLAGFPDTLALAQGVNVPRAVERVPPSSSVPLAEIGRGLQYVLERGSAEFQVEYSVGAAAGPATFEIRGFACELASRLWVLVTHDDVTVKKQAEALAITSAQRLKELNGDLEILNTRLERLASVDELTGLFNRRAFEQVASREWRLCLDENLPFSLILFDVDCFKLYNDSCGHPAGDQCLRVIASVLNESTAGSPLSVARFGGEEFALILPGHSLDETDRIARSIQARIRERKLPHPTSELSPHVTVSGGCAGREGPGDSLVAVIHRADQALYAAKRAGRNRIICLPPEAGAA